MTQDLSKIDIPVNPLMQKVKLPGRIFQLPSRGIFYKDGELSSSIKNGELHIHAMSAIDEINMKNPDMLFSGRAIEEVCRTCIPDVKKPKQLLARDIDAILLFLRVVSYGNLFEIDVKHTCTEAKEQTYSIDIEKLINNIVFLDPTEINDNYQVVLPNEQVVSLQPARYQHVIELLQNNEKRKSFSAKDIQDNIIHNLLNLINDIDGITNREQIEEWLRSVEVKYINAIANKIDVLNNWGPKTVANIVCRDCGEKMEIDIPLNPINFFSE